MSRLIVFGFYDIVVNSCYCFLTILDQDLIPCATHLSVDVLVGATLSKKRLSLFHFKSDRDEIW